MRRYISCANNVIGYNYQGVSFNNIVVRERTPIDEFYFQKSVSSDNSSECIAYTDPIRMLFNQQRLDSIGSSAINEWIDSLQQHKTDPLAHLRSKCSDADLKAIIKSRHIQQPSEVMAFAEWCKDNMETFNSELQKLIDSSKSLESNHSDESSNIE